MQLGYDLGKARQEQSRLREVERVMQLEAASYKTPERVEIVARTLLGMEPPVAERVVPLPAVLERPAGRAPEPAADVPQAHLSPGSQPEAP